MFKKFFFLLLAAIVVFLVVGSFQSDELHVVRSATIAAPPGAVFEQVNNLKKWDAWSPWAKLDSDMKITFEGPESGVGAVHSWAGNSKVGEGKMTITESKANEQVVMRLEFLKPFAMTNTAEFTFKPEGNQTSVTWRMSGKKNLVSKCMGLIMDCDKMIGGDFEKGFSNLKSVVETPGKS